VLLKKEVDSNGEVFTSVNITAFSCTSEKKMHYFTLFLTAAESQNGDFQSFPDSEKTKAL